jgi:hypothetical protein
LPPASAHPQNHQSGVNDMPTESTAPDQDPSEQERGVGRLLEDMGHHASNVPWPITGAELRAKRSRWGWSNTHALSAVTVGAIAVAAGAILVVAVTTSAFHSQPTHLPRLSATATSTHPSQTTAGPSATVQTTSPIAPTTSSSPTSPTATSVPTTAPTRTTPTAQPPNAVATTPSATESCLASNLTAQGGRQGEAGTAQGEVILTNGGSTACVLSGDPSLGLMTSGGSPLGVTQGPATRSPDAPLTVAPGSAAILIVNWSNWCSASPGPLQISIGLAGGGSVVGPFDGPPGSDFVPPCIDEGGSSSLVVADAYLADS